MRQSDFCFSAGLPFPLYSTGTAELRCCYQKYISYLLVMRYILLQEKCSVLFVMMMTVIFIQLMCYYLTLFLSSFNIIFLIIFEPRFICWLEFLSSLYSISLCASSHGRGFCKITSRDGSTLKRSNTNPKRLWRSQ